MTEPDDLYLAYTGQAPRRVPHIEHWSCPDAETAMTGIDYYAHPRFCRLRMRELYPQLGLPVPETDEPKPRPGGACANEDAGGHHVRWGDGESWTWDWGGRCRTAEEALAFSPLANPDFTDVPVVESRDYSDEEALYRAYRAGYPPEWGDRAPEGSMASAGFYNTMFMWPLLTFGWAIFLEACLDPRFDRVMDEFAEINRRVFRVFARLPVNFVFCHDDIVTTRGPVCSRKWMYRHIFPRYEEFWSIVRAAGKRVIFITDGCIDRYADDVLACGAAGFITEPYADYRAIARRHENVVLAGEGDNRILTRNETAEIEDMVRRMVETSRMTGGYLMCIGNHIPWNVPPDAIRRYLDLSVDLAVR